jgi:hypothetical protein
MRQIFMKVPGVLVALMPAPSTALAGEPSNCESAIILNSIDFHGSVVCDPDWLDRPSSLAILAEARSCKNTARSKMLLARGFSDFDNSVKELGKTAACQKLDDAIKAFEKS